MSLLLRLLFAQTRAHRPPAHPSREPDRGAPGEGRGKPALKGKGTLGIQTYHWRRSPPAQKKNPFFVIHMPASCELRFTLRRRTGLDRLGIRLGLTRELSTHDPRFDTPFFLNTPHPRSTTSLFSRTLIRTAAQKLFHRGFTHLHVNSKGIHLKWTPYRPLKDPIQEEEILSLATSLHEILRGSQQTPPFEEDREHARSWRHRLSVLYTLAGLAAALGLGALISGMLSFPPLDPGHLFLASLPWALGTAVLGSWPLFSFLRGYTGGQNHALGLAALGLAATLLLGPGGMLWLNGYCDTSPPRAHQALVVNKWITRSKDSRTYHVSCSSWRAPGQSEELKVSRSFFAPLRPGQDSLELVTRKGHLGYEWLVSYRLVSGETGP